MIVIGLVFVRSIVLGFAEQSFSIVRSVDCSVRRPIAFGLTEPSVSVVHSFGVAKQMSLVGRWLGRSVIRSVGRSLVRSVGWLDRSRPRPVDAFYIVLAIILLSGLRRNHSLNDHASTSDLHQDRLHTLRDHLDFLDLHPLRSPPASTMLRGSSVGTPAVTPLLEDHPTSAAEDQWVS